MWKNLCQRKHPFSSISNYESTTRKLKQMKYVLSLTARNNRETLMRHELNLSKQLLKPLKVTKKLENSLLFWSLLWLYKNVVAPATDHPKMHYFGGSDTHPMIFLKSPSNLGFHTSYVVKTKTIISQCSY